MNFRNRLRTAAGSITAVVVMTLLLPAGEAFAGEPKDAEFYKRQWNLKAIHAHAVFSNKTEADAVSGALVAVVDTGIDYLHPDLQGRVDLTKSTSLVTYAAPGTTCVGEPGIPYGSDRSAMKDRIDENAVAIGMGRHPVTDFHSHGTGVSGLIASNADKLAGVTQGATLFGVKVHGMGRQNCLSVYLAGIRYAADQGADVIHMSIPLEFNRNDTRWPNAVTRIFETLAYARERGAVLVAAAGNNGANVAKSPGDDAIAGPQFRFCQPEVVFCVSATAPASADLVEEPYWDEIWPMTNYGSAIDVAGPGGSAAVPVWLTCSTVAQFPGAPQRPCREGSYLWQSTGTSFGAAATSGLAALLFRLTGETDPAEVERLIQESADDLGAPGPDPYYGEGRINVKQAVQAVAAAAP